MHRLRLLFALFFSFLKTAVFTSSAPGTKLDFGSWFRNHLQLRRRHGVAVGVVRSQYAFEQWP
jgi:hypothetical protein